MDKGGSPQNTFTAKHKVALQTRLGHFMGRLSREIEFMGNCLTKYKRTACSIT